MTGPDWGQNITPEGRQQAARHDEDILADTRAVTPGHFAAMGIPLRRGRVLTDRDWGASDRVCVINETMAREVWGEEDPIGKRFKIGDYRSPDTRPWVAVVGVVADTKRSGLMSAAVPEMYIAGANPRMAIVLRTAGDPAGYIGAARDVIRSLDRNQPISKVQVLERIVADSIAPQRITMWLAALFAAVALLLTGTGLYGVIAHSVAQRTHEIGIRMAVGADHKHVARLVVRQAMALVLAGLAVGALAALLVTRMVSRLLFEVSPRDPATLIAVAITVIAVAWRPAIFPLAGQP
jgi:putative ABC transport system permease protein